MSFSKIAAFSSVLAFASTVAAHGKVIGLIADGITYPGYDTNSQYKPVQPIVAQWSTPEDQGKGPVAPSAYATPDIICHIGATNAKTSAPVKAGGIVSLEWDTWPDSHLGPIIDYLANCNGDCTTVDKTTLEFFKIDAVGRTSNASSPGTWASDQLLANNLTWNVVIPTDIASGNYVLRHEIIALHSASGADGAQNYPFCVNLKITSAGTATPAGTKGEALYTETDPGILVDINKPLPTYIIPGPALYSGAIIATQTPVKATGAAASGGASSGVVTSGATSVTAAPSSSTSVVSGAPSGNGTSSTSSAKVCKSKSTTAVTSVVIQASSTSSGSTITLATSLTIATSINILPTTDTASSTTAVQTSAPSSTGTSTTSKVAVPAGTTLGDLLGWVSAFYTEYIGKSYTGATAVAKREHARDVVARAGGKFRLGENGQ